MPRPRPPRRAAQPRRLAGFVWLGGLVIAWCFASFCRGKAARAAFALGAAGTLSRRLGLGVTSSSQKRPPVGDAEGARTARGAERTSPELGTLMLTEEAPFLSSAAQPLLLSPDGTRTARYELDQEALRVRIEPAPAFGPAENVKAAATARDVLDRVGVMKRSQLGSRGVRDLFWLDDAVLMSTGFEIGIEGKFFGWVLDLRNDEARLISMPHDESSLFVPTGADGQPMLRVAAGGGKEVLLGFWREVDGERESSWSWYNVATGDLEDAAIHDEDMPTTLWREAVVSKYGDVEALLLWNGTVCRRGPRGWQEIGSISLATSENPKAILDGIETRLARQYLVSVGPDNSVFAIDTISPNSQAPQVMPPLEHLQQGGVPMPDSGGESVQNLLLAGGSGPQKTEMEGWVLRQCKERRVSSLVQITSLDKVPFPLFAHPFADVTAADVWINPDTECPEVVSVNDLRPWAYGVTIGGQRLIEGLREGVPESVELDGVRFRGEELTVPVRLQRRGDRCLVSYWHPALDHSIEMPAVVKGADVSWISAKALPSIRSALTGPRPRVEGHRLQLGPYEDLPIFLILPESQDPVALVVRVHEGPDQRDSWGADAQDSWLLSRGYGVLKVNYRGSSGFGGRWRTVSDSAADAGFLDDVVAAVRWVLYERRAIDGADLASGVPPVAIVGSHFGGYAVLQGLLERSDLFACGIAIGPVQDLQSWPDAYAPDVTSRREGVRPLIERVQELREVPLLLIEFEKDSEEARGHLMETLAPPGTDPANWPTAVQYVQYAGEGRGGGTVRQSLLDQYRRIDAFLFSHLSAVASKERLLHEPFVDEVPFLSASMFPHQTKWRLSPLARSIEQRFEEMYESAFPFHPSLPSLEKDGATKPSAASFGSQDADLKRKVIKRTKSGKRSRMTAPASRLSVREDGVMEIAVAFDEPPRDLHVMISEVWLHMRATGFSFTLTLPRKPLPGKEIKSFKLPDDNWMFEIEGDPYIGAIDNYNLWASSGQPPTVIKALRPEEMFDAPMAAISV